MGYTRKELDRIRAQVAADQEALREARTRRDDVLKIAATYPGTLETYIAGSLAAGLMNRPVTDGDCGLILDRRVYPDLGPDGANVGPLETVAELQELIQGPLCEQYPRATVQTMKRGLLVEIHAPLDDGQDPTVDLVLALNRREDDALWIPRIDWEERGHTWDPGHPKKHLALIRSGSRDLVRTRAHVIRVAKAWKGQFSEPGLCSFHIVALALEAISEPSSLDLAMATFFAHASTTLQEGGTEDPARVSDVIELEERPGRDTVVRRLSAALHGLTTALEADDDEGAVREALQPVFPKYLNPPADASSKAALADAIRTKGTFGLLPKGIGLTHGPAVSRPIESTRSYGNHENLR